MHIVKTLLVSLSPCLLVFLCASAPLWPILGILAAEAQQPKDSADKKPPVTFEELRKIVQEIDKRMAAVQGNPLTKLDALRALEAEYAAKGPAARSAIAVRILTVAPEVGNYEEALRYADIAYGTSAMGRRAGADELKGYRPVDALNALARAAEAAQVVMINEAHHVPQHRAFTIGLLKKLRNRGFTHFATETLYEKDTQLNERGYPTAQTGYYTGEPVYGDLIRIALRLGFRVIPYEVEGATNPDERERGQARNLVERILKDDPKARILIHAGYAHIDESGADRVGAITMAQRFKETTGIDPLTIEQTEMTEHNSRELEHPLYRHVLERGLVTRPTVFRKARGELWMQERGRHDVTLFHPRSRPLGRDAGGRPDWLRLGGSRGPYRLPKDVCGAERRCLVRARLASEPADAIPIDQLEVLAERQAAALMLPAGEFIIEVQDPEGRPLTNFRIRKGRPR
jgi:hypothetical protein